MTVTAWVAPWDHGLRWRVTEVSRDEQFLALRLDFVRDLVLRSATGNVEDELIEHYIRAATAFGERQTGRHISPKTLQMQLDAFPSGAIEFADGPIRSIESVSYLDSDGVSTVYDDVSPHTWVFVPGGVARRSVLRHAYGDTWPSALGQPGAVTVNFTVGYESATDIPHDIRQAIAVTVGEFYKSPDLSNADDMAANVLGLEHFWPRAWSNAL